MTPPQAREFLALLKTILRPTVTTEMDLHHVALDVGIATNHSPDDAMSIAFALAGGADGVVMADTPFERNMRTHPDSTIAALPISLEAQAAGRSFTPPDGGSILRRRR